MKKSVGAIIFLILLVFVFKTNSSQDQEQVKQKSMKRIGKKSQTTLVALVKDKMKPQIIDEMKLQVGHDSLSREEEEIGIDLPSQLKGKILLTQNDKESLKKFYVDGKRIKLAIHTLKNTKIKIQGEYGLQRIKSVDFLEKSLRYRDNPSRSMIVNFIDEFIQINPGILKDETSKKFYLGDQLEMLEVLAYNYPAEFFRLQEKNSNEVLRQMFKLVEHHAKK